MSKKSIYSNSFTNADKIRIMNNEEMYLFLEKIKKKAVIFHSLENTTAYDKLVDLDWLNAPFQED